MIKILFIFIFLIVISIQCDLKGLSLNTSEDELSKQLDKLIQNNKQNELSSCLELILKRGYYKAALQLYEDYFMMNGIDITDQMRPIVTQQKRDLDTFNIQLHTSNTRVQIIEPAVQWAQSKDIIFLNVKLSMRSDSPACLNCKIEKVTIENQTLFFSAFGILSHQPLRFQLNYSLFDEVDEVNSTWIEESVGQFVINLVKKNNTLWPQLEKEEQSQKKISIWWDMREKYKQDMDDWTELVEQLNEKKEQERKEKRKKEKEQRELEKQAKQQGKKDEKKKKKKENQGQQDAAGDEQQQGEQKVQEPIVSNQDQVHISEKKCEGPGCGDL